MKLILTFINFNLYHKEENIFVLETNYNRWNKTNWSRTIYWNNDEIVFKEVISEKDYKKIPKYIIRKLEVFIPKYLSPFKVNDTVVYKNKEYTVVDVTGLAKINGEWKEVISYIEKFGKVKYHREKEDFIDKFKLIERG